MKCFESLKSILFAAIVIPTDLSTNWKIEEYSNRPKNQVSFSNQGLRIQVNKSAGPLIFPLKSKSRITGFKVHGEFLGLPQFLNPTKQGEKGFDDYPLRLGFVIPGEKKLSGLKKIFAAEWVKRLYEQVPQDSGIDSVRFFNVTQNPEQVGKNRSHPSSDLIQENFFAEIKKTGRFSYDYQFEKPLDAVAVWISIDGDDTQSAFDVLISEIVLQTNDN